MVISLKYHHEIFDLLKIEANIDSERLIYLNHLEAKYNIILPESIKEYFLIDNLIDALKQYNVFDNIVELVNFAQTEKFEGLGDTELNLLKERKVMPLFSERSKEWTWFLNLKAELDDPKVLLHSIMFPDMLISHPHKFSKQLFLNVWDNYVIKPRFDGYYLSATSKTIKKTLLYELRRHLHEITTSYIMIANETTYRFQRNEAFIAIIDDGMTSNWYFHANSIDSLRYLVEITRNSDLQSLDLEPTITGENEDEISLKRQVLERFLNSFD